MIKKPFTLSGYTTTANAVNMQYPFEETIRSLLGFCDEVIVVDAGSTDGTIEVLAALNQEDPRVKYYVEPVDYSHPRWAIYSDGYLKAKARGYCTSQYCWQTDCDEVVPPEDYVKITKLPEVMGAYPLLMLPMVEFWGTFSKIRGDFFTWKARFSRNHPDITHGIPAHLRELDKDGHEYPRPFYSDTCNYIFRDTREDIQPAIPVHLTGNDYDLMGQREKMTLFYKFLDLLPAVHHVSWLDFERKILHYKSHWQRFQSSMYNLAIEDIAENNWMFDKPWSEVTAADIKSLAAELHEIGPRSFHSKIDRSVRGVTFPFNRPIPPLLLAWQEKRAKGVTDEIIAQAQSRVEQTTMTVKELANPKTGYQGDLTVVSAIVPSYNKAQYLEESVGSLISQSYPALEIIVVDDGSPDNTREVTEGLIRKYPKVDIRYLAKPNGGISDARNFAIERAKGDIILTLDGDDLAKPGFLTQGLAAIKERSVDLVCTNVEIFGHEPGEWYPNQYSELSIRYDNSIPSLVMFTKALWKRVGGYDTAFPFVEDWDFFIGCAEASAKVERLPEKLFLYRSSEIGLAHLFKDSYPQVLAMVMTSRENLYSVDEVLAAHSRALVFPERFWKRFAMQRELHPNNWLLHFWHGLELEAQGNIYGAIDPYIMAINFSNQRNWQPAFRLALIFRQIGRENEAEQLLYLIRLRRPDMSEKINALKSASKLGNSASAHTD